MPMYDYVCRHCESTFADVLVSIADRDTPTQEPCPICQTTGTIERCASSPNIGDAVRLGRTQLPSAWTDKLSQIKSKHYKSTMHVPTPGKREV